MGCAVSDGIPVAWLPHKEWDVGKVRQGVAVNEIFPISHLPVQGEEVFLEIFFRLFRFVQEVTQLHPPSRKAKRRLGYRSKRPVQRTLVKPAITGTTPARTRVGKKMGEEIRDPGKFKAKVNCNGNP